MAYATLADMLTYVSESELIELTDDSGTAVDDTMLAALLNDSSAELDSYLPAGATVPAGSGTARRVVCMLTLYHLYARRGGVPSNDMRIEQFKDAQFFLTKLAQGLVRL